jgi:clan AA aspartic protease
MTTAQKLIAAQDYTSIMGLVYANIELVNAGDMEVARRGFIGSAEIRRVEVQALVDSGAYMLVINAAVRDRLGLAVSGTKRAVLADGSTVTLPIVGPVEVRFANRSTVCEALVVPGGEDVLLGAIPMEGMDLMVDPNRRRLIVNPEHPDVPSTILK